jgi:hypothetical protein
LRARALFEVVMRAMMRTMVRQQKREVAAWERTRRRRMGVEVAMLELNTRSLTFP